MVVFPELLCLAGKSTEGNLVCDASSKVSYRGGVRCKDEERQRGKAPFSPFHCLAMLIHACIWFAGPQVCVNCP